MNYGYAGTRELNEALVSRFLVIDMPALTKENLYRIIRYDYPKIKEEALDAFGGLFLDCLLYTSGSLFHKTECLGGSLSAMLPHPPDIPAGMLPPVPEGLDLDVYKRQT